MKSRIALLEFIVASVLARVASFQQANSPPNVAQQRQYGAWGVQSLSYRNLKKPSSSLLRSTTSPTNSKAESAQEDDDDSVTQTVSPESKLNNDDDTFVEKGLEDAAAALKDLKEAPSSPSAQEETRLSMPWSQNQEWALRDNLPKYTIMVPLTRKDGKKTTSMFALWRTMLKEVPELAGYPIDFLQERHADDDDAKATTETPAILPYLDDYEFTAAGGISGLVYGIPGLANGARIETSAVTNIEVTLVQGFVCTSDGSAAYELGRPKREAFVADSSTKNALEAAAKSGSHELLKTVGNSKLVVPTVETTEDADGMLVRLGASTAILLAGATAMNMLAHHLTVNVFWV